VQVKINAYVCDKCMPKGKSKTNYITFLWRWLRKRCIACGC